MRRRRSILLLPHGRKLVLGPRTLVMGVVNVTPDSFSDGGEALDPQSAIERCLAHEQAGADLLDLGGESTRPGSRGVSAEEELKRILPVLEGVRGRVRIPVSVDTTKAAVAEAALEAGASMLNDISGLRQDPELARVAARARVPLILMHIRGEPRTMQQKPFAQNVWRSVEAGLTRSLKAAAAGGVRRGQLLIDPGIGFGKSAAQNFEILHGLRRLESFRLPVLIGTSRKSFIGQALGGVAPRQRVWGTAATVTAAILNGAHIVRVHDVAEMVQVVRVADEILKA